MTLAEQRMKIIKEKKLTDRAFMEFTQMDYYRGSQDLYPFFLGWISSIVNDLERDSNQKIIEIAAAIETLNEIKFKEN